MALIYAHQNLGLTHDITINNATGAVTPQVNDKIKCEIGHAGETVKLSVSSDAATANGSSFTKNTPSDGLNRLRLDASDLTFNPGVYTLTISYFDNADSQEWKLVDKQVFVLEGV